MNHKSAIVDRVSLSENEITSREGREVPLDHKFIPTPCSCEESQRMVLRSWQHQLAGQWTSHRTSLSGSRMVAQILVDLTFGLSRKTCHFCVMLQLYNFLPGLRAGSTHLLRVLLFLKETSLSSRPIPETRLLGIL